MNKSNFYFKYNYLDRLESGIAQYEVLLYMSLYMQIFFCYLLITSVMNSLNALLKPRPYSFIQRLHTH